MRYWLSIFFIILIFSVKAQSGGEGAFAFLKLTNSAAVAGLGGINVSNYGQNSDFAFHNPALLSHETNKRIGLNYVNYFTDINFGYVSYAQKIDSKNTLAIGLHYVNYGTFTAANDVGTVTGEFTASDYALNLIWARDIFKNLRIGLNMKPIYSHLESYKSIAVATDAGISYRKDETGFSAGLTLKNIGFQIKPYYEQSREPLPFDLQAGVSKRLAHAPFRVHLTAHHLHKWNLLYEKPVEETDFMLTEDGETNSDDGLKLQNILDNAFRHTILAVEIIPAKSFYISVAYNQQRRQELRIYERGGAAGFSFGFGLNVKKFGFNFGRQTYHLAGGSNHFSLYLNLNEHSKSASPEKIAP